jgi:hypothetical protein
MEKFNILVQYFGGQLSGVLLLQRRWFIKQIDPIIKQDPVPKGAGS